MLPTSTVTRRRGFLRAGFTVIELLIVIVIIGILASIAMPKLNRVRERGYFRAIMSDLRNLQVQQEIYYAVPTYQIYANDPADIENFESSGGVQVNVIEANNQGWSATAGHSAMSPWQFCAVYVGTVATPPAPATQPGTVTCTGD